MPNYPTLDPNSPLGRRMMAAQPQAPGVPGVVFGGGDLGGQSTADPSVQAILQQQNTAALGQVPPGLLPGGASERGTPVGPQPAAAQSPVQLAAGQTPLAPVQTQDPFRLYDPGLGPVAGAAAVAPGQVIPINQNDPRSRNPFMYQDGGTWRSSLQAGGMGANGFTPGFVSNGANGAQTWAGSPQDFLMALHQNAAANGVNPTVLAQQFLGQLNSGADLNAKAGLAAQKGGVDLATGRMQADAQRDSARLAAEGAGRAGAFAAIPGFMTALTAGNVPPGIAEMIGGHITNAMNGGAGGARPGGSATPFGGPMGPGGPSPGPTPGAAPAAPGLPSGGNPAANPFAAAAAAGDAMRPLQALFGARNAAGVVTRPEGFNLGTATNAFLDRFASATPEQRQQMAVAAERGDLGDPTEVLNAIARRGAVATLRSHGGSAPGTSRVGNMLQPLSGFLQPGAAPGRTNFTVNDQQTGNPLMTLRNDPNQSAIMAGAAQLMRLGVPYNQAAIPGYGNVGFDRGEVSGMNNAANSTPELDRRHSASAMDFIRMTNKYRTAAGVR